MISLQILHVFQQKVSLMRNTNDNKTLRLLSKTRTQIVNLKSKTKLIIVIELVLLVFHTQSLLMLLVIQLAFLLSLL